jgi:hypothetical protein
MVLVDAKGHSKQVQVIRCDIKPGSIERSIDLDQCEVFKGDVYILTISIISCIHFALAK